MWVEAYLEQARSDWQTWEIIRQHELPACHSLHYLQMACEKLGKACLISGGTLSLEQARSSHVAFKRFLQVASRNPGVAAKRINRFNLIGSEKESCLTNLGEQGK